MLFTKLYTNGVDRGSQRRRHPGVEVDAAAIRRAREEAGLSLADVAGQELSRSAVHRVEAGQVRPSMNTLRLIAGRVGVTVESLLASPPAVPAAEPSAAQRAGQELELALELARLEAMCAEGRYQEVADRAAELTDRPAGEGALARVRYWSGVANVQLHEAATALVHLRQARETFERHDDEWMVVECMGWEAAALALSEDRQAVGVAAEALRRCRELDPVPRLTESRILGHLAGMYLTLHEWEQAASAYRGAIEAAGGMRDLASLARMYDGLSIAYQGIGDLATAATHMQRAVALNEVVSNHVALARLENNLGLLLLRRERLDEAEEHLNRALTQCTAYGIEQGRSHVLLSLAQLHHARGDHETAAGLIREAIDASSVAGEHLTVALAHQWLGKVLASMGRARASDRAFETALAQLGTLASPRRLAECHRDFAEALQARDELRRAIEHWQRAADLWQPQVDAISSQDWIEPRRIAT